MPSIDYIDDSDFEHDVSEEDSDFEFGAENVVRLQAPKGTKRATTAKSKTILGENNDDNVAQPSTGSSGKTIEQIYQKKSQLEHILLRPDTYSE